MGPALICENLQGRWCIVHIIPENQLYSPVPRRCIRGDALLLQLLPSDVIPRSIWQQRSTAGAHSLAKPVAKNPA